MAMELMAVHLESDDLLFAIGVCCGPRNQLEARGLLLLATYSNVVWLLLTSVPLTGCCI